ncbi:MAG: hypothetical protein Q7V63_02320 [Gammaproteobacteria bacterium]|nr:hypothetical protein [Gammaproteobacteria bacterium]
MYNTISKLACMEKAIHTAVLKDYLERLQTKHKDFKINTADYIKRTAATGLYSNSSDEISFLMVSTHIKIEALKDILANRPIRRTIRELLKKHQDLRLQRIIDSMATLIMERPRIDADGPLKSFLYSEPTLVPTPAVLTITLPAISVPGSAAESPSSDPGSAGSGSPATDAVIAKTSFGSSSAFSTRKGAFTPKSMGL